MTLIGKQLLPFQFRRFLAMLAILAIRCAGEDLDAATDADGS
jgi:hypothetical protein